MQKKSPIQLFEQFPARIYWTTCFICLHWLLLNGTPCTMKLLSISHVTWLHYFHYIVLRVLILYTMYICCLSCWYYLLYPADIVYPADTMLFIQLIRYCLSSWYYVVYPADTIVTVICFYTMLCICDKYLLCLVCIGFAYIICILQDTYNTLFFNNHDNLFNRY